MDDHIWVLEQSRGEQFGGGGVAKRYMIPAAEVRVELAELAGTRLWIVLRGRGDRLFQAIFVRKVERMIDGYYMGDVLITAEIALSARFAVGFADAEDFATQLVKAYPLGVSKLAHDAADGFAAVGAAAVQTRLIPPPDRFIDRMVLDPVPRNDELLAQRAMGAVISSLALSQIWASAPGPSGGAFANFAAALIRARTGSTITNELAARLQAADPMLLRRGEQGRDRHNVEIARRVMRRRVDMELSEIVPENVRAREFVASSAAAWDWAPSLSKTQAAERVHQDMLRDISEYLIRRGVRPYESGSIDLLFERPGGLCLLELKSATNENILAQAARGAFQIACYEQALVGAFDALESYLVLVEIGEPDVMQFVAEVLGRLGVRVLVYDREKQWPERIVGLIT